jgi:hypothetical protein
VWCGVVWCGVVWCGVVCWRLVSRNVVYVCVVVVASLACLGIAQISTLLEELGMTDEEERIQTAKRLSESFAVWACYLHHARAHDDCLLLLLLLLCCCCSSSSSSSSVSSSSSSSSSSSFPSSVEMKSSQPDGALTPYELAQALLGSFNQKTLHFHHFLSLHCFSHCPFCYHGNYSCWCWCWGYC